MCVCVCARSDLKRVPVPAQRLSSCIMCTDEQTVHNKLENLWTDIQETQYYRILQKRVEPFETRLKSNKNNAQVTCKHRCRAHPVKLITYLPQPPSPHPKKTLNMHSAPNNTLLSLKFTSLEILVTEENWGYASSMGSY